jgi:hypothetical protein
MSVQNARKRELITRILKGHPELTDRAIAKKAAIEIGSHLENASHPLVAAVRRGREQGEIIPHIDPDCELDPKVCSVAPDGMIRRL